MLSLLAAAIGWAAATAVTLPMVVFKVCANALGGWRPLVWSLGAGTAIWLAWTLSIAAGGWLGGVALAVFAPEEWLLRNRGRAIAIAAGLGWLVVLIEFKTWRLSQPGYSLSAWLFSLYSLLLVVFTVTAAASYLHWIARSRAADERRLAVRGVNLQK